MTQSIYSGKDADTSTLEALDGKIGNRSRNNNSRRIDINET